MQNQLNATPSVLQTLVEKRGQIAVVIEALQRQLKDTVGQLDSIEATIRVFQPDIDLFKFGPRPVPPPHAAFKGEVSRILLQSLRASKYPLSTRRLTEIVMQERGLPLEDIRLRRTMQQRVGAALNNWKRRKKVLLSSRGEGAMLLWQIDPTRIVRS
jgi:hypothetical protein